MQNQHPYKFILRGALLALVLGCAPVWAQMKAKLSVVPKMQPPALIDREIFFGNPEISGAQLSPDGKYLAFIKPYKDTRNIWVKGLNDPFDKAKLITNDTKRPIPGFFWSRDGKYILFTQDQGGDENYNVYAVNPAETAAPGQEVPPARNLTSAKNVAAQIYSVPKSDPDAMFVGLNDRDPAWHDLYKVKISTGERALLRQNTDKIAGWLFDNAGNLRMAARLSDKGDTEILNIAPDGKFVKVYECGIFESCNPLRFDKTNTKVYLDTNKGNRDLSELVLFDPATGKETPVEGDPMKRVDFGGATFSDKTDEILATSYEDDKPRVYLKNKAFAKDYDKVKKMLGGGREISVTSVTSDETLWTVSSYSDTDPGTVWLYNRKTGNLSTLYQVREKLPREAMAPMTPIRYKSSDGLEIPAYLTLPKGVEPKNLPLVVFPHGGPWGRDSWGYDSYAQFLANRGYAVLQPNFRASTGYGKKFLNAGNKQWGDLMQDDITWGVKHLTANGTADAKRVGIMGGSYGGYATLAGVTYTPDVYAAAVAIVAPSNLITLLETIPPYWEAGRIIFHERMGNPNTPDGKAQLLRQSPLSHVDKIKTPLMVVQGANDPRVNKRESDQIVVALRERGFPVQYIVAPDEGHGFQRPVNNMAMIAASERFLAQYLGGRFQDGATPEVAKRLAEITVDPKTVTLAKKIDAASVSAPKPMRDLTPGTLKYNGKLEVAGQTIPLPVTQEIKEENGAWVVTEIATIQGQEIRDQSTLEKGTLLVKQRNIRQGPVAIDFMVSNNRASGTAAMAGPAKPFDADLGGPLFADGAGSYTVIAQLPLAEGYTATFRNFDTQKQKVDIKQLKVVGMEAVTVPAGKFNAYKVEIGGDGNATTIWIDPATRRYVKLSAVLASMGGATLTVELAQ